MMNAGTPCPYDGMIGEDAKLAWQSTDMTEVPEEGEVNEKWINEDNKVVWK